MKSANQILSELSIDRYLTTYGRIKLRQQGSGNLHESNSPQVERGGHTGKVTYYATAQRDDQITSLRPGSGEKMDSRLKHAEVLVTLSVRHQPVGGLEA